MNCIFLTRGKPPKSGFTLTLTGALDASGGYVTVSGTKYTTAKALELDAGTEVAVHVGGSAVRGPKITYNGTTVSLSDFGKCTYTFSLSADTTITFAKFGSSTYYYTADITTS